MQLYSIKKKYKEASITFKATIWYTICNMLQKIAAFLIIPFLTRMLTTSDYGLYSVFLSWESIIEILATMRMYSNGYVSGCIKYNNDQDRYTSSIQFMSVIVTATCFVFFWVFKDFISNLIQIKKSFIYCMFFSFFATSSIGIWSSRQRVNNRYKLMVIVTLLYSVLTPILSIIGASVSSNRLDAVIIVRMIAQFTISVPFFFMNIRGAKRAFVFKYCKEALIYNIPLIPYYLSSVILNSSDRIMIKSIVGEAEAGIYSVAHSLSMAMFVFVGALNLSLQPWIFNKLKANDTNGADKVISFAVCLIAILNIGLLIASPELIRIVASEQYMIAIWTMPPMICSLLIMFIYQQLLNINFYFGENRVVFIASIIATVLNLILNLIFIRMFGFLAAGYTTLVSYLVIAILYYISMRTISKRQRINYKDYFNIPLIMSIVLIFGCFTVMITFLYPHPIIRYGVAAIILALIMLLHQNIIQFVKQTGLLRKGN